VEKSAAHWETGPRNPKIGPQDWVQWVQVGIPGFQGFPPHPGRNLGLHALYAGFSLWLGGFTAKPGFDGLQPPEAVPKYVCR